MKKNAVIIAFLFFVSAAHAQVLTVPLVSQEQNQWCWAGVTQCVLGHYGRTESQCNIAEYTRSIASWHSYGTTNCCVNATVGCNYPNYNWGQTGSIQDILVHFGSISNTGTGVLSATQIATEMAANHLFVAHWNWTTGGGHFVVGHGISGTGSSASVYYMNPWPTEGFHIAIYAWMQSGTTGSETHTWDGTNKITSFPATSKTEEVIQADNNIIYPNPSSGDVWVKNSTDGEIEIFAATGRLVHQQLLNSNNVKLQLGDLPKGIYFAKLRSGEGYTFSKLVLQ